MMYKFFLFFIIIFTVTSYIISSAGAVQKSPQKKSYTYYIKKGGIFRYLKGSGDFNSSEAYLKAGMTKSDIMKLDDMTFLSSLNINFDGERVKYISIKSQEIRTSSGLGVGSPIEKLNRYQPVNNITGAMKAYTPPYSGLIFCSNTTEGLIDFILIYDPSISNALYTYSINSPQNQSSVYVRYGIDKTLNMLMDEIIITLYKTLKITPSSIQEVILLSSRADIGEMCALYGGQAGQEATSFCVNEPGGSVIYALYPARADEYFKGILSHEYAHAWHYRYTGKNEVDPLISEGFAEWVRYHYQGSSFKQRSEKVYIKGLELFLAVEQKRGIDGVYAYLLDHSWKPENIPAFK